MFIDLKICQYDKKLPRVLLAGDTGSVFGALPYLQHLDLDLFVADTGIVKRNRLLDPHYDASAKEVANTHYDFFENGIGAGIYRRMDMVVLFMMKSYWPRLLHVPCATIYKDKGIDGFRMVIDGLHFTKAYKRAVDGKPLQEGLKKLPELLRRGYSGNSDTLIVNGDGTVWFTPECKHRPKGKLIRPIESPLNSFSRVCDLLTEGERLLLDERYVHCGYVQWDDTRAFNEIGVPMLDILTIQTMKQVGRGRSVYVKYVELSGDESPMFDRLLKTGE